MTRPVALHARSLPQPNPAGDQDDRSEKNCNGSFVIPEVILSAGGSQPERRISRAARIRPEEPRAGARDDRSLISTPKGTWVISPVPLREKPQSGLTTRPVEIRNSFSQFRTRFVAIPYSSSERLTFSRA